MSVLAPAVDEQQAPARMPLSSHLKEARSRAARAAIALLADGFPAGPERRRALAAWGMAGPCCTAVVGGVRAQIVMQAAAPWANANFHSGGFRKRPSRQPLRA